MSLLRDRMIEDMQLHGYSASTQELYARAVSLMSKYVHHGPDKVTEEELPSLLSVFDQREEVLPFNHNRCALRNQVFLRAHAAPGLAYIAPGPSSARAQIAGRLEP